MVMAPTRGGIKQQQFPPRSFIEHSTSSLPPDRDYFEGLIEDPLQTIDIPTRDQDERVRISDCTFIGSYNWVKEDTGTPTILVPGTDTKSSD